VNNDLANKNLFHGRDWVAYYDSVSDRPPRKTLLTALNNFDADINVLYSQERTRKALDLGCGCGRDTVELLRRGWYVGAIDAEVEGIIRLLQRSDVNLTRLSTQVTHFEAFQFPENLDLINASFSLPFCNPQYFGNFWQKIVKSLRPGGRFCGHFFGDRDSWSTKPYLNCYTRQQVEELLQPFAIELFEEEEHLGKTPLGEERYWHIFHIVARKN
jgi:tellurite methyltransferase